jgi:exodeoxyribonuclease VII large subunit
MNDKYLTVSDINKHVKNIVDGDIFLNKIYLKGEISNFKFHSRGHLYFSLKDDESKINAVMFEFNRLKGLDFEPTDGMNVLIEGKVSVYVPNGAYQIYVEKMTQDGLGNLYIEFEKLKKKLEQEGLFLVSHKRLIPKFPEKIGIITASTGAAIKDILSTIKRRYPICETILFPTLVQGEGAKENIVKQIKMANTYDLDVIILGRGGGSIEDLWAFNEEIVARAIYDSKIPIISAVGHDIDFTISDFVADLRAATPTGAAELAVPNIIDLKALIKQYKIRSYQTINNYLNIYLNKLKSLKESYILKNPLALYEVKEQKLSNYIDRLNTYIDNLLERYKFNYKIILNKITLLNPLNILEKGYSVVSKDKEIIKSTKKLKENDEIIIKLYEGKLKALIKEIL